MYITKNHLYLAKIELQVPQECLKPQVKTEGFK